MTFETFCIALFETFNLPKCRYDDRRSAIDDDVIKRGVIDGKKEYSLLDSSRCLGPQRPGFERVSFTVIGSFYRLH